MGICIQAYRRNCSIFDQTDVAHLEDCLKRRPEGHTINLLPMNFSFNDQAPNLIACYSKQHSKLIQVRSKDNSYSLSQIARPLGSFRAHRHLNAIDVFISSLHYTNMGNYVPSLPLIPYMVVMHFMLVK